MQSKSYRPNTPDINPEPSSLAKREQNQLDAIAKELYGRPYDSLTDRHKTTVHETKLDREEAEIMKSFEDEAGADMDYEVDENLRNDASDLECEMMAKRLYDECAAEIILHTASIPMDEVQ